MKKLILLTPFLLLATPSHAQDAPAPAATAGVGTTWLDQRSVLSMDTLLDELNTQVTPGQRSEIQNALNERNAAVAAANAKLSAVLKKSLAADDNKLAVEAKDAKRLDRIRRLQPSRYQELMRRKAEEDKAKAEKK